MEKKNGTGHRPAPKRNQIDYNRIMNACIVINLIGIIILYVGIWKDNISVITMGTGLFLGAFTIQAVINPIESEE